MAVQDIFCYFSVSALQIWEHCFTLPSYSYTSSHRNIAKVALIYCTVKFAYLSMPCFVILCHIMSYCVIQESTIASTQEWIMHRLRAGLRGLWVKVTWLWTVERLLLLKLSSRHMAKDPEGSTWTIGDPLAIGHWRKGGKYSTYTQTRWDS
jgi:hypothetical protein